MPEQPQYLVPQNVNSNWAKIAPALDQMLDDIYRYRGSYDPPQGVDSPVWALPPADLRYPWASQSDGQLSPDEFFLHYFQSQGLGPTSNECVTTSTLIGMNMAKDRVALRRGQPLEPDRLIEDYIVGLDKLGITGWMFRFSTKSPLPGMMTPLQALMAYRDYAGELKRKLGGMFEARIHARLDVNKLIQILREGNIVVIHGAWKMTLDPNKKNLGYNPLLAWLGGMPHTMVLCGYDGTHWVLINPANPWLTKRIPPNPGKLTRMTNEDFLNYWGRKFLFYPPRCAVTILKTVD